MPIDCAKRMAMRIQPTEQTYTERDTTPYPAGPMTTRTEVHNMRRRWWTVLLALFFVVAACSAQQPTSAKRDDMAHARPATDERPVLYDSLGSYSYRITTSAADAQRWFDQGLRLVYAFNHHEAQKAFREAARLDPKCAMCFWGIVVTEGSNYNSPTDAEREKRALGAVQRAQQLAAGGRPQERALVEALAKRHSADPGAKRDALDRAYADAMRDEATRELGALEAIREAMPPARTVAFFFRANNMLQLAANVLAGEIAAKAGDTASAERLLRAAVAEQDTHWFTEPPPWYFPVRQALGAVLLQAGRPGDAEQVYREDLRRNPGNGWSLFGLAESLRAQGKSADAAQVEESFRKAWARADVRLPASRF